MVCKQPQGNMQKQTAASRRDGKPKLPPLKEFLDRCYILDSSENYEKFLKELEVKKNVRFCAIKSKPRVVLSLQKDEYHLRTSYPELRDVIVKFRIGEPVKRLRPGGSAAASVFYVTEDKLVEEQQFDDKRVKIERVFTKRTLTITMEVNDVRCSRFYVLSSSKHSIGTETSRRSSMWRTPTPDNIDSAPAPEIESILGSVRITETESADDECY